MPIVFKVTMKVGWKSNNYEIHIKGNSVVMKYEKSKGVLEVLDKLNKDGLNAIMTDSTTIVRTINDMTEEEIIKSSREELEATAKAVYWPVTFKFKEEGVKNEKNSTTSN